MQRRLGTWSIKSLALSLTLFFSTSFSIIPYAQAGSLTLTASTPKGVAVENVVVSLTPVLATTKTRLQTTQEVVEIIQKGLQFEPYVTVLPTGRE